MIVVILSAIILILLTLLVLSIIMNVRFYRMLTRFEDNINESLDELDVKYSEIIKITNKNLHIDTPEARQITNALKSCKDTILSVASKVSNVSLEEKKE